MLTIKEMVKRSAILKTNAKLKPMTRAFCCLDSGNLPEIMDINITLSIPKTISIAVSVMRFTTEATVKKCSKLIICSAKIKLETES